MITLTGLTIILFIAIIALFWHRNNAIKEQALQICKQACERRSVQFLDGSIAPTHMQIKKPRKYFGLMRRFTFEYFNGEHRFTGIIFFFRQYLVDVIFDEQGEQKAITDKLLTSANDKESKKDNIIPFPAKKTNL